MFRLLALLASNFQAAMDGCGPASDRPCFHTISVKAPSVPSNYTQLIFPGTAVTPLICTWPYAALLSEMAVLLVELHIVKL